MNTHTHPMWVPQKPLTPNHRPSVFTSCRNYCPCKRCEFIPFPTASTHLATMFLVVFIVAVLAWPALGMLSLQPKKIDLFKDCSHLWYFDSSFRALLLFKVLMIGALFEASRSSQLHFNVIDRNDRVPILCAALAPLFVNVCFHVLTKLHLHWFLNSGWLNFKWMENQVSSFLR